MRRTATAPRTTRSAPNLLTLPILISAALFATGCDRPTPPAWTVAEPSRGVEASEGLTLDTSVAALEQGQVALIQHQGVSLRLAYDGRILLGEVSGVGAPTKDVPVVVYAASSGGAIRQEFRFQGAPHALVRVNGDAFGGSAPRAKAIDGVMRFGFPQLGGDLAITVLAGTPRRTVIPAQVATLGRHGGLHFSVAPGGTIIGLQNAAGDDQARYQPGDSVTLIGAGLDEIASVEVGKATVTPAPATGGFRTIALPSSDGDTDTVVPILGAGARHFPVALVVEGTVHRIGDAMGTFAGSVWGLWLVILLVGAGVIFTVVLGFPQFKGFGHAIAVVRGRYDNPDEKGEISHFQALTTALSATVGLGNIAGVAVAITAGGPGALFWMWVCGFLGMATKFSECSLSTAYREVDADGTVRGGPMYYMKKGLPKYLAWMGVLFGGIITLSSFGGGNMFQANQAAALWEASFGVPTWVTGIILVALVGLVIVGGIKRIGRVTDKLVPLMCGLYVLGALAVIIVNIEAVPGVFGSIFSEAFGVSAAVGGVLGIVIKDVVVQGMRRAAFSNEAGFGSAAIAHAAVKTDEPIREGTVALLEPFIDTIVICTMTGLVILLSGVWTQQGIAGAPLTAAAFDSAFDGFGSMLVPIAVFLFAISTMISWSYYGEQGVLSMFGKKAILPYRLVFVGLVFIGSVWKLGPVLDFSDGMFGLLAVPNILALLILLPKLLELKRSYFGRLKSGEMVRYDAEA